jgi:hypothetical protein
MPDLSLSQLADFAKQGKNMSDSFYAPLIGGQAAVQGYYNNKYLPSKLQAGIGLTTAQGNLAQQQAFQSQAMGNQINKMTPAQVYQLMAQSAKEIAQGNSAQADANLTSGKMPYDILKAKAGIIDDSHLKTGWQASMLPGLIGANGPGGDSPAPLDSSGLPSPDFITNNMPGAPPPGTQNNITGGMGQIAAGSQLAAQAIAASQPAIDAANAQDATTTTANESAKQAVPEWNAKLDELSQSGNDLVAQNQFLEDFHNNYKDAQYKGAKAGTLKTSGFDSPIGPLDKEQLTDLASSNLKAAEAKLYNPKNMTDYELQEAGNRKLSRALEPGAEKSTYDFYKAKNDQLQGAQKFYTEAKAKRLTRQQSDTLWHEYMSQRPAYDFQNNRKNENFIGDYAPFLSDEAISSLQSGSGNQFLSVPKSLDAAQRVAWHQQLPPETRREFDKQQAEWRRKQNPSSGQGTGQLLMAQ